MQKPGVAWSSLLWLAAAAAVLCCCLPACTKVAQWRNQQISQSHQAAASGTVTPPGTAIVVPEDIRRALPIDPTFTLLSYADGGDQVQLQALSAWDAQRTSEYVLSKMNELGYSETDNPSNLLSTGLRFENSQGRYKAITVKVELHASEQCTLDITASRE